MNILDIKNKYEKRLQSESPPEEHDFIEAAKTIITLCEELLTPYYETGSGAIDPPGFFVKLEVK